MRLSKNYYNIYKNKNNEIPMTNDEIIELENKKQNQILDDLKLQLIKNLKQNIDEFAHLIEQNNINELNNHCLDLKNNCDKMNIIEVFQKACEILYNLFSKFSVYKSEKENQINNLSNQVFYLLKEKEKALNKEESKFDNSEIDEKTQKKISMKEEEVKQLKEVIQSLNSSKNDLSKENVYLKQQISEIYSEFQNKNNSNIILSLIEKINKNRENIEKTDEELIKIKNMYNEYGYIKNILNKNKNLEKRLEKNFSDRSRSKGKKK
jgi:DNA repair exonuclease SbcCD ATPase subunit